MKRYPWKWNPDLMCVLDMVVDWDGFYLIHPRRIPQALSARILRNRACHGEQVVRPEFLEQFQLIMDQTDQAIASAKRLISKEKNWCTVTCPRCGGEIKVTVSSYNGHMSGKCSTDGCLYWME